MRALVERSWIAILAAGMAAAMLASPAAAQSSLDQRYATWLAVIAHGPLHGDLWLWADVHGRFYDTFEPQAVIVRPGVSWRAHPDVFLTLGYAWTPSWREVPDEDWAHLDFTDEHRAWEQVLYQPSDPATGIAGQVRVRLEQRFRTAGALDVGLRLRIFLRGHIALSPDRAFLAVLWNEVFTPFNDTSWGQRAGFDQNRLFFGFAYAAIVGVLRFELGYMNQWIVRATGPDPVNHVAVLNTFVGWR